MASTGRFDEAETFYGRALAIAEETRGRDAPETAAIWHNLGGLLHAAGRAAEAEAPARRALEMRTAALGVGHPDAMADGAALAAVLVDLGRLDEAEALLAVTRWCSTRTGTVGGITGGRHAPRPRRGRVRPR